MDTTSLCFQVQMAGTVFLIQSMTHVRGMDTGKPLGLVLLTLMAAKATTGTQPSDLSDPKSIPFFVLSTAV